MLTTKTTTSSRRQMYTQIFTKDFASQLRNAKLLPQGWTDDHSSVSEAMATQQAFKLAGSFSIRRTALHCKASH